jgi:hypothetical protein
MANALRICTVGWLGGLLGGKASGTMIGRGSAVTAVSVLCPVVNVSDIDGMHDQKIKDGEGGDVAYRTAVRHASVLLLRFRGTEFGRGLWMF